MHMHSVRVTVLESFPLPLALCAPEVTKAWKETSLWMRNTGGDVQVSVVPLPVARGTLLIKCNGKVRCIDQRHPTVNFHSDDGSFQLGFEP